MPIQVLVLGATGAVGSLVAEKLMRAGRAVRAASRNPKVASAGGISASEFVEFDLEKPSTFMPALSGVDCVFLIARPGDDHPERVVVPLIQSMKTAGIRHVVNLTAMGVERREDIGLRRVELLLEASGLDFTHLRPNWFMQVFCSGPLLMDIRATGAIHLPSADARISYVDARDVAAVAARVLLEPGHARKAYTLTGSEPLSHRAVAGAISEASGQSIRYVAISDHEARQTIEASGISAQRAERLIGFYRLVRAGFCEPVSSDVQTVLGRDPISFERFVVDHAACWG